MNAIIRKAIIYDTTSISELNKKCLPIYYSYVEYLLLITSPTYLVLVAEINNEIIGYMVGEFHSSNKNFHILSIGVDDKVRSKGIGTYLINKLIIDIKEKKYDNITLFVHDENEKAIKFYIKNDFVKIEHLPNYYEGSLKAKSQGAVKMRKLFTI